MDEKQSFMDRLKARAYKIFLLVLHYLFILVKLLRKEVLKMIHVKEEKIEELKEKIASGASPSFGYFLFLILAVMIASFGLINNSAAVIIGAMLISPLMTPIFGAALAIVTGRSILLRKSLFSVFFGVFLSIMAACFLGLMPFTPLSMTSEILGRTSPNLFDIVIAALAGLAGAIAMIDDSVGESLPGVAISTSLAPPLGASGLCLAMGNFASAYGAFLLFFTNFLIIFLIGGLLFYFTGFAPAGDRREQWLKLKKPFWVTVGGLVLICYPLGKALHHMHVEQENREVIEEVFRENIEGLVNTSIVNIRFRQRKDFLNVFAVVRASEPIRPGVVTKIEEEISERLDLNTELIVRCNASVDVVARGTNGDNVRRVFGNDFIVSPDNKEEVARKQIEQTIRELFDTEDNTFQLKETEVLTAEGRLVALVRIQGFRELFTDEVKYIEKALQKRLEDPKFRVFVSCNVNRLISSEGQTYFPKGIVQRLPTGDRLNKNDLESMLKVHLKVKGSKAMLVDVDKRKDYWNVIVEYAGQLTYKDVNEIQAKLAERVDEKVKLYAKPSDHYILDNRGMWNEDKLIKKLFNHNNLMIQAEEAKEKDLEEKKQKKRKKNKNLL